MFGIVHFHIVFFIAIADAILVVDFGPFSLRRSVAAIRVGTRGGRAHGRLHELQVDGAVLDGLNCHWSDWVLQDLRWTSMLLEVLHQRGSSLVMSWIWGSNATQGKGVGEGDVR